MKVMPKREETTHFRFSRTGLAKVLCTALYPNQAGAVTMDADFLSLDQLLGIQSPSRFPPGPPDHLQPEQSLYGLRCHHEPGLSLALSQGHLLHAAHQWTARIGRGRLWQLHHLGLHTLLRLACLCYMQALFWRKFTFSCTFVQRMPSYKWRGFRATIVGC